MVQYDPVLRVFTNRNMMARNRLVLFVRQRLSGSCGPEPAVLCRRFRLSGGFSQVKPRRKKLRFPRCWSTVLLEGHLLEPLALCRAIRC